MKESLTNPYAPCQTTTRPRKVAQCLLSLECGGMEKLVIQLASRLQAQGIDSPIITLMSDGILIPEARQRGIRVSSLNKGEGFNPLLVFQLKRWLRKEGVELLHTHNFAPLIYGGLAARLAGIPVVNTRHGRAPLKAPRWVWRCQSQVVSVSQDALQELQKHNALNGTPVDVIYNGIDVSAFRTLSKGKKRVENRFVKRMGMIARLSPEKDHRILLRAFQLILLKHPHMELWILGDGPLREALESEVWNQGLREQVRFLGFRQDIPDILEKLDIFVLATKMEGLSMTLLEAMAAGLPVVASSVGGNPEVVVDGETGFLVPAGDAAALADAVVRLLEDLSLSQRMGSAGRRRVEEHFSIEKMVKRYVQLYGRVVNSSK